MPKEIMKYKPRLFAALQDMIAPLCKKLDHIDEVLNKKSPSCKYYRNEYLKKLFGLSSNTIVKYRQTGLLPYTKLGDIYLYEVQKINEILKKNEV